MQQVGIADQGNHDPIERHHPQPVFADIPHAEHEPHTAGDWVRIIGPSIHVLIAEILAFAPDLQHAISVDPQGNPPQVTITLSCERIQVFRYTVSLWADDTFWHARAMSRLGGGPTQLDCSLRIRGGSVSGPWLDPEAVASGFRRSLRHALHPQQHV